MKRARIIVCFQTFFLVVTASAVLAQQPLGEGGGTPELAKSAVDEGTYIIGPGDVLQVFVWRNPELTASIPVRPDGRISTPLVADIQAVGKTPTRLAKDIENVLAEYIRAPQVSIIVTSPNSALSQVKVIGQVANPSAIPYREGLRVLDVLLAVGGLHQFAAGNRAQIVRVVEGKEKRIRVRLEDLTKKGDLRQNLELRPGDVLIVPESFF